MTTIWPYFVGLTVSAAAAGALAVPAARNLFLGDVEADWLGDELDLDSIGADGVTVHTKQDVCFRVYQIEGQSYEAKPVGLQDALLVGREVWLHRLGELGVAVRLFGVKRLRGLIHGAEWPSPALTEIGREEAAAFRHVYEIRWFAVLSTKGDPRALAEASDHTESALADYRPEPVRRGDGGGEENGCPLSGFLNLLVCGDLRQDLAEVSSNVSANLQASDLVFERDGTVFARQPLPAHYRVIGVSAWPEEVSGEIISELLALPGEIEVFQAAAPGTRDGSMVALARKRRELGFNPFASDVAEDEHGAVMELLGGSKHVLLHTQFTVIVRGPSASAADALAEAVGRILARRRVRHRLETSTAPAAWFNRIPGHEKMIRPLRLLNTNVGALWPFQHAPSGRPASPWGEGPVRLFRTGGGGAYAFQFHVYDRPQANGHYLVFAPTGAGKTTLMMHLLGGLAKFEGVRSYVFDSKQGARFAIEAMGGLYQSFDDLRLNPLDVGGDTPENRQRIAGVMTSMLGEAAGTDEAARTVKRALDQMFKVKAPNRTFDKIFSSAFPPRSAVQAAFAKWVTDKNGNRGHYAHVFKHGRDSLGQVLGDSSCLTGINMNEILSDGVLAPPVVAHIGAAISKTAAETSVGFNIFIDEAAALLPNPGFRAMVEEMFREYRKLDGAVGMAFQDPRALLDSGVAEAVIENAAALIFFPSALATEESLEPFRLNDEQREFILRGAAGGGRRVMVIKREAATGFDESAILDVDLAPFGKIARFYRSGTAALENLKRLKRNHGEEWINHV